MRACGGHAVRRTQWNAFGLTMSLKTGQTIPFPEYKIFLYKIFSSFIKMDAVKMSGTLAVSLFERRFGTKGNLKLPLEKFISESLRRSSPKMISLPIQTHGVDRLGAREF